MSAAVLFVVLAVLVLFARFHITESGAAAKR